MFRSVNDFVPQKQFLTNHFSFTVSAEYFWLLKFRCITNFKVWNGTLYISDSRIDHTCTQKCLCNFSTRTVSVHLQSIELLSTTLLKLSSVFEALSFSPSHSWSQFIEQVLAISQYVVVTYFLIPHLAIRNYLITTLHLNTTTTYRQITIESIYFLFIMNEHVLHRRLECLLSLFTSFVISFFFLKSCLSVKRGLNWIFDQAFIYFPFFSA